MESVLIYPVSSARIGFCNRKVFGEFFKYCKFYFFNSLLINEVSIIFKKQTTCKFPSGVASKSLNFGINILWNYLIKILWHTGI